MEFLISAISKIFDIINIVNNIAATIICSVVALLYRGITQKSKKDRVKKANSEMIEFLAFELFENQSGITKEKIKHIKESIAKKYQIEFYDLYDSSECVQEIYCLITSTRFLPTKMKIELHKLYEKQKVGLIKNDYCRVKPKDNGSRERMHFRIIGNHKKRIVLTYLVSLFYSLLVFVVAQIQLPSDIRFNFDGVQNIYEVITIILAFSLFVFLILYFFISHKEEIFCFMNKIDLKITKNFMHKQGKTKKYQRINYKSK